MHGSMRASSRRSVPVLLIVIIIILGAVRPVQSRVESSSEAPSQVTGPVTIEPAGTTWSLTPEDYRYLWFTAYGPSLLAGQFQSDSSVTVFIDTASEFSAFESSGVYQSYTCLVGKDILSGSFPCELPAGDWYVIFLNDQRTNARVSLTSDLAWYPVYFAQQPPYVVLTNGTSWSLNQGQYIYQKFSSASPFFLMGAFKASNDAVAYVFDSNEYSIFATNNTVSSYYCTTGIVSEGSVNCRLGIGDWYLVIQNPTQSTVGQSTVVDLTSDITMTFLSSNISNQALYDEQLGLTFVDGFASLAYEVTATPQTDIDGIGPDHLLNGLSNNGYWYQVGLAYNWETETGTSYTRGFKATYEMFSPTGGSISPVGGGGGSLSLSGPILLNDRISLGMVFSGGDVILSVNDITTDAYSSISLPAFGATEFVGNPTSSSDSNGFFTGLMTEWYHEAPYYQNEQVETYSPHGSVNSPAWLWADEYFCLNTSCGKDSRISIFHNVTDSSVNGSYSLATNGATLKYLNGTFITGGEPIIPIIGSGTGSVQSQVSSWVPTNILNESSPIISTPLGAVSLTGILWPAALVLVALIVIALRRHHKLRPSISG